MDFEALCALDADGKCMALITDAVMGGPKAMRVVMQAALLRHHGQRAPRLVGRLIEAIGIPEALGLVHLAVTRSFPDPAKVKGKESDDGRGWDFAESFMIWRETDGDPAAFWRLTPRLFSLAIAGAAKAAQSRDERAMSAAWHAAAFQRAKKLPKLDKVLRRQTEAVVKRPSQARHWTKQLAAWGRYLQVKETKA